MSLPRRFLLLGWVSGALFAFAYKSWPVLTENRLAKAHLWLYQVGLLIHVSSLALAFQGMGKPELIGPVMGLSAWAIIAGMICFGWNIWRNVND